jgi:hypothetical protein
MLLFVHTVLASRPVRSVLESRPVRYLLDTLTVRGVRAVLSAAPVRAEPLSLFMGDGLHRVLVWVGVEKPQRPDLGRRAAWGVLLTWFPLLLLTFWSGNMLVAVDDGLKAVDPRLPGDLKYYIPRLSFVLDLAAYAQFVGFIPLAFFAEMHIGRKIQTTVPRLRSLADERVRAIARSTERLARTPIADLVIIVLAGGAVYAWAGPELHNNIETWHTTTPPGGTETFTYAGYWVAFVSLPLFTYLWMRWAWKVVAWTYFLVRVSRLPLALRAAHPDRTGGLGCLSDVQTSFAAILFGTGILFSAWGVHKFVFERTPLTSMDVWGPILVYLVLAPLTFTLPLILFTKMLGKVKREGLIHYGEMATQLAGHFERRWLRDDSALSDSLLDSPHSSSYADFSAAYVTVESMRVVPFDRRSFLELFSAAATPLTPLAFFLDLPEKVRDLIGIVGG